MDSKRALAYVRMEMLKVFKGITEYKRLFCAYFLFLIVCVSVFVLSQVYPFIQNMLSASRASLWGVVTAVFVHSSYSHLAYNMTSLFLFIFLITFCCSTVRKVMKKKIESYLFVTTFSFAIISNVLWVALTPNPSVGASGLVYAMQGSLAGLTLFNGLPLLNFSKLKAQSPSVVTNIALSLLVFTVTFIMILTSPESFLNIGQGVNSIAHGVSFLLALCLTTPWCFIEKISLG